MTPFLHEHAMEAPLAGRWAPVIAVLLASLAIAVFALPLPVTLFYMEGCVRLKAL